ncbi:MAG: DNA ligase [Candidatus Bathyarchaeota archaeon]|nr:DNA ligase [Candidatus Bathyarchaeota archaeon]
MSDSLKEYKEKRDFGETPEPEGEITGRRSFIFVVQKHAARNLHYDLRLESGGVLKSWAVPKGPSMDPKVKRLAVPTEDHPMAYHDFEGVIPQGHYGAGTVIVWDSGTYRNLKGDEVSLGENLEEGHATVWLEGEKLRGGFAILRTGGGKKPRWLFFKMKDEEAMPGTDILVERPESVKTGRSLEEVAEQEKPTDMKDFS